MLEISAGGALIRRQNAQLELLMMKVRNRGYELPKGHLEGNETPEQAALRELQEETGLVSSPVVGPPLGTLEYDIRHNGEKRRKRVHYFLFANDQDAPLAFAHKPSNVLELRWIHASDVASLPLVNESLRAIVERAFLAADPTAG